MPIFGHSFFNFINHITMKKFLFLVVLIFPSLVFAQKIKESKIDDFTGEKVIYTSWETIKKTSATDNLMFMFRHENKTIYLHLKWVTNAKTSIEESRDIMFKLNDDKVVKLSCLKDVKSSEGGGATGFWLSGLEGIDPIYIGDFSAFNSESFAEKVRISTDKGYKDIDLKVKDTEKINKAYKLLLKELRSGAEDF